MEHPQNAATVIELKNFEKEFQYLTFLVDPKNENIHKEQELSVQAGEIVGKLYDTLLKAYGDKDPATLRSLNVLCVRIVFCLYAEDAGLFPKHLQFFDYLKDFPAGLMRDALLKLFKILDTPEEKRSKYESQSLLDFPYVNGGLFASQDIDIPQFTEEIKDILLQEASSEFDWSAISPTIFGAVFESTLNPETRRKGGMHYTSITNIHKVIDPLFLDDLRQEFEEARKSKSLSTRNKKLLALQDKMAGLTFLDPACGSGNFLTETFTSLRTLENDIIRIVKQGQGSFEFANPIKVSISQFYGIEINDFAVSVAKTALWIAESQMMIKTQDIVQKQLDFLPLKSNANIHEGNALRMDWNDVVPASKLSYIMGNPPFLGYSIQNSDQKQDIRLIYSDECGNPYKTAGKNDYVSGWFFKAASFIKDTKIHCAFVSTNSITQGEQVANVWKPLFSRFGIHINFAYTTFKWTSESLDAATVHVVVVGFSCMNTNGKKKLFTSKDVFLGNEINPYLRFGEVIFLESRKTPLSKDIPPMSTGNRPADGGHLILSESEYKDFVKNNPTQTQWIKKFTGSDEFLNNSYRYCLWLVNAKPKDIESCKAIADRVESCRIDRLAGAPDRQKLAKTPHLFRETKNPESYLIIPFTSSENSFYIPIGFLNDEVIPSNGAGIIENAGLYEFGVLSSSVHMAWMRAVAGRLEMRYRYSKDIVYNNFPWPAISYKQKEVITNTAKKIIETRSKYPDTTLAEMYRKKMYLYTELVSAHEDNDKAVLQAYSFKSTMTEPEIVAELFKLYEARVKELEKEKAEVQQKTKVAKRRKQGSQQ